MFSIRSHVRISRRSNIPNLVVLKSLFPIVNFRISRSADKLVYAGKLVSCLNIDRVP